MFLGFVVQWRECELFCAQHLVRGVLKWSPIMREGVEAPIYTPVFVIVVPLCLGHTVLRRILCFKGAEVVEGRGSGIMRSFVIFMHHHIL